MRGGSGLGVGGGEREGYGGGGEEKGEGAGDGRHLVLGFAVLNAGDVAVADAVLVLYCMCEMATPLEMRLLVLYGRC